ncbi:hypothetical protein QBC34DRAFT_493751 [Podospora aff. communis PSN243]|uniref:2EXR domain-containing protein n=1 Tax=Podospora aff. communis PSN243 TaxID=3040156 RepID=A0AAV9GQY1_9PEZI|nr:hypothetical protein QBC34DRAFT_493751 [Podospora aff. communis PSN243]
MDLSLMLCETDSKTQVARREATRTATSDSRAFPFSRLPAEIRIKIWEERIGSDIITPTAYQRSRSVDPDPNPAPRLSYRRANGEIFDFGRDTARDPPWYSPTCPRPPTPFAGFACREAHAVALYLIKKVRDGARAQWACDPLIQLSFRAWPQASRRLLAPLVPPDSSHPLSPNPYVAFHLPVDWAEPIQHDPWFWGPANEGKRMQFLQTILAARDYDIKLVLPTAHTFQVRRRYSIISHPDPPCVARWSSWDCQAMLLSINDAKAWDEVAEVLKYLIPGDQPMPRINHPNSPETRQELELATRQVKMIWRYEDERDKANGGPGLKPLPKMDVLKSVTVAWLL